MTKHLTIKDIYAGKPDAKDEIGFEGIEEFVKCFVVPDTFNIDGLLHGNEFFISGYKGTGKTALLFYLDHLLKTESPYACSSFIFFKEEFSEVKKHELEGFSKRIMSSVSLDNDIMLENTDFEYIWRWIFFKRIVSDNEEFGNNLFIEDDIWRTFVSLLNKIKAPIDKKKAIIPSKVKLAIPVRDPYTQMEISPEIVVDFQERMDKSHYSDFICIIEKAEELFSKLIRTDTPYYIFVDELEAYFGEQSVFIRDLHFIRDLIFTVKRLNGYFVEWKSNTKIICSVRTEILNSISRFIVAKEINKVTSGFEVPLIWNYNNTNSFAHPIIQIIIKRIQMRGEQDETTNKDIYNKWFPEKISGMEPANYILNNGWNKPRDIVRLLISAQNSIKNNETCFNQSVFDAIRKKYSTDSLLEIKEEMRALYSADDIDIIFSCFTGFKTQFSAQELKNRITKYYSESILEKNLNQILRDLYRLGIIGNCMPSSQTYRWQHRGDDSIILAEEWSIMIHYALQSALSLNRKQDVGLSRMNHLQKGDRVSVVVTRIIQSFALVDIIHKDKIIPGRIHVKDLNRGYVVNINDVVSVGHKYETIVIDYNDSYGRWNLRLIDN